MANRHVVLDQPICDTEDRSKCDHPEGTPNEQQKNSMEEDDKVTDVNKSMGENDRTTGLNNIAVKDGRTIGLNNSTDEDERTDVLNNSTDGDDSKSDEDDDEGMNTNLKNSVDEVSGSKTKPNNSVEEEGPVNATGLNTNEREECPATAIFLNRNNASESLQNEKSSHIGNKNADDNSKECADHCLKDYSEYHSDGNPENQVHGSHLEDINSIVTKGDTTTLINEEEKERRVNIQEYTSQISQKFTEVGSKGATAEIVDVETDDCSPTYRTNRTGRTLNQKVRTHVVGVSLGSGRPTSLLPRIKGTGSKEDLRLKAGSTVTNLSSCHTKTTKLNTTLRQSYMTKIQRCEQTSFAFCTYCEHKNVARYSCEECLINCCSECIYALHPPQTRYRNHTILSGHTALYCKIHDESLSWYCSTCDQPICAVSLACSSHASHDVENLDIYIKNEKKQLLDLQRQVGSRCLDKAHVNLNTLREVEETVRLQWIQKKQHIRQEFAKLRHVIGETENMMIKDGQKDFELRIQHINSMRRKYGEVVDTEARLTQMSLDSVNGTTKSQFLETVNDIQEKLSSFQLETEATPTVNLAAFRPSSTYLSLFQVTMHLQQLRQSLRSLAIRPHQKVLFVPENAVRMPITTHDLWQTPDTTLELAIFKYSIEIKEGCSSKSHLWKVMVNPGGLVVNGRGTCNLETSSRYLMKVTPQYRTMTGCVTYETTHGIPCHIFIITATDAMDESPDLLLSSQLQIDSINLSQSFEKTPLSFRKCHVVANRSRLVSMIIDAMQIF
ncbi:uncharacterized protein LOC132550320 [Ylistrum balloti]|uniref:uncharacterized protein LOC132550320 n=1 Tax=Ylistrum balloti TaxID=509963 RepID=UPI002905A66F|nr:uncharacterized protein LOC132550320 [Ylistrum balloti]